MMRVLGEIGQGLVRDILNDLNAQAALYDDCFHGTPFGKQRISDAQGLWKYTHVYSIDFSGGVFQG